MPMNGGHTTTVALGMVLLVHAAHAAGGGDLRLKGAGGEVGCGARGTGVPRAGAGCRARGAPGEQL